MATHQPTPDQPVCGGVAVIDAVLIGLNNIRSRTGPEFIAACHKYNIGLRLADVYKNYTRTLMSSKNVITWGVKVQRGWYEARKRNCLYIENGLFSQAAGFWIDSRGWFADSSLRTDRRYFDQCSCEEYERIADIAETRFGWTMFSGGNPDGPVMFAGQTERDAPVRHHFPGRKGNAINHAIELLADHFPADIPMILRPHPRAKDRQFSGALPHLRGNWKISVGGNVYQALTGCRALVTINSTLATEALALGIPVATLGNGAFSGAGATLECAGQPERLRELPGFRPDHEAILRYLAAVMRHQLPYSADAAAINGNREFKIWAEAAK